MLVIGIDPGVTGAMGILATGGWCDVVDLPVTTVSGAVTVSRRIDGRAMRLAILEAWHRSGGEAVHGEGECPCRIACESVRARPQSVGERRHSIQSEGSLLRSLGAIEAVADIVGSPAVLIEPQAWQGWFGLMGKSTEAIEKRAALKAGEIQRGELPQAVQTARKLFPKLAEQLSRVKDHNRAEALLIARFYWRKVLNLA